MAARSSLGQPLGFAAMLFLVIKNCALGSFFPPPRNLDLFLEAAFAFRNGCQVGRLYLQILMNCMTESVQQLMQVFAEYGSGSHAGTVCCNQLADVWVRALENTGFPPTDRLESVTDLPPTWISCG
jgi:hypothetical protein